MNDTFDTMLQQTGEIGFVQEIKFPIVVVSGLPHVQPHEMILFEGGQYGQVFLIGKESIQVLLFANQTPIIGSRVARLNTPLAVPVGVELLGTVIDPLGQPIAVPQTYKTPTQHYPIDAVSFDFLGRSRIKTPFLTGVALVDMMIPLGKGQRQLIVGDRKTGKSSFLLTALKNQVSSGSIAIYAAIGRKKSDIRKVQDFFEKEGMTQRTVIVASSSFDSPSLIYITPYSAMTIAEYFRDFGQDVVVVLDDLSTHAKFYREISLLANRFPGRDAYPGDIFYTHARLLERAGNFHHASGKEVSITALPVVETVEGDFTGYLATNLMGMTDGHIFFDSNVYYKGQRPAVNISLSVTRVGRQTQTPIMGTINHELTSLLALYEKMQNLSHFGAELKDAAKQVLATGDMVHVFFDQQHTVVIPLPVQIILFAILWLNPLNNPLLTNITLYRENLIQAYYEPRNKAFFDEILSATTFNDLLGNINKNSGKIYTLCKLPVQPKVVPAAPVPQTTTQTQPSTQVRQGNQK